MTSKSIVLAQKHAAKQQKSSFSLIDSFTRLTRFFTKEISETNIRLLLVSSNEQGLLDIVERNRSSSGRLDRMDMILYKILGDHNDDRITLGVRQLGNLIRKTVLDKRRECG